MSNDDPAILAASGFTAKPTARSAPQPVGVPAFRSLDLGVNSGQIVVSIKGQAYGKVVLQPVRSNGWSDAQRVDDNPGGLHSEADHDLRPDTSHDLRVPGAGSRRARLFRLECDRDDHLHLEVGESVSNERFDSYAPPGLSLIRGWSPVSHTEATDLALV